jgi:tetratricopeptide (TPR) repeat protein
VQGDYENALGHARKALALAADGSVSHADALIYLGIQLTMLRRHGDALPVCTDALDRYERLDHVEGQANCLLTIGMIHQGRGDHAAAVACYERSSTLDQRLGDRYWEAISQERLGEVHELIGQPDRALRHWQTALNILDSLGHPEAARLRDRIARAST